MRFKALFISILAAFTLCFGGAFALAAGAETASDAGAVTPEVQAKMTSVQVPFVPNEGQVGNDQVKFYAKTFAGTVFVTNDGITYDLPKGEDGGRVLEEEFAGGETLAPAPAGAPGAPVNYYLGSMEKHLSSYQEITLGEVYDKIKVNLRAYGDNVEKILTVAPGGDPAAIMVKVAGADKLSVNDLGELELATGRGTVKMTRPAAYQDISGVRVDVQAAYELKGDGYGFRVGEYDRAYSLVIDPLIAATYLGGTGTETGYGIARDSAGYIYVSGVTKSSTDFPATVGAYDRSFNDSGSNNDAFVAKLDGGLTNLIAATYLGGSYAESSTTAQNLIAVGADGSVYLTGMTKSSDFPTPGGYDTSLNNTSKYHVYVARLSGGLSDLLAATFLDGTAEERPTGIALDAAGSVFVAGYTSSPEFPHTEGAYDQTLGASGSGKDGFVSKLSGDLSSLLASTFIGGAGTDNLNAMALDADGNVLVGGDAGYDSTHPFPATPGAFDTSTTDGCAFISRLSNDLTTLQASTFFGDASGAESVNAIAVDALGSIYVTGTGTVPTIPGAYSTSGSSFVSKFNSDLTQLQASTLVGGGSGYPYNLAIDADGRVFIAGYTDSGTYPTTEGAYDQEYNGGNDGCISKFDAGLTDLLASTFIGGSGSDNIKSLIIDPWDNLYFTGSGPDGLPTTPGAYQTSLQGTSDAYVAKLTGGLNLAGEADATAPVWSGGGSLTVSNVTYSGLTLNWSGAMDNWAVTGYEIYQDGSVIDTVYDGAASSYNVTSLPDGTQYTFKVEAGDAAGNWSADGPTATATTETYDADTAPTWPSDSTLTPSNITETGVTLTWTAAADDTAVTGYKIFKNDVEIATVSSAVYTYDVTGLTDSNLYTFRVEAGDAAGQWSTGGPTADVSTTEGADTVPPYWPQGYSVSANATSLTSFHIVWNAAADNVAVTSYRIYLCVLDGAETIIDVVDGSTLSYDITGLDNLTWYGFKVEAGDAAGNWTQAPAIPGWRQIGESIFSLSGAYLTTISENVSSTGRSVTDADGIPLKPTIKLVFTNNVVNDAVWDSNVQCVSMQTASGDNIPINVFRIPDTDNFEERNNIFVTPVNDLAPDTQYRIILGANLTQKNQNNILGVEHVVSFTTAPAVTGDVTVAAGSKDLLITGGTPSGATVTVPGDVTNATINVSSLMNAPAAGTVTTGALPALTLSVNTSLSASPVLVTIPGGMTISADAGWDGTINVPSVRPNNSVAVTAGPGKVATVTAAIEIGFGDVPLTFDRAVRIVLPGQTGKEAGYVRGVTFTKITNALSEDSQTAGDALPLNGEGKFDNGADLVIWTKHFTQFVTYTQASSESGGSADTSPPTWPGGGALTSEKVISDVDLSWTEAVDNVGVIGYRIYMDGGEIKTVGGSTRSCKVTNVQGPHTFKVEAGDNAGNWSTDGPEEYVTGTGDKPLNYVSANLTTLTGSSSSSGDEVEGNTSVPARPVIRIVFDKNVTTDLIWPANQSCFTMQDSDGASVSISVTHISNTANFDERQHVFITPASDLTAGETYKIIISKNLVANNGNTLGSDVTIFFTVVGGTGLPSDGSKFPVANPNAPVYTTGSGSVDPALGATVGLGSEAKVIIPENALIGTRNVTVTIKEVTSPPAAPSGFRIAGKVYEFTVGDQSTYTFNTNVGITLSFDPSVLGPDETAAVYYYDQSKQEWVSLGGTVTGNTISVMVNHFTKFAVFAVKEAAVPVVAPGTLTDITGHWAEANIRKLVELGAVSGYEDGTFKPDSTITRAEFATILVKAFKYDIRTAKLFSDTADHWARDYLSTAAVFGIAGGYEDGSFRPDDLITREQMAVMVVKAAKLEVVNEETQFADSAGISEWARSAVATAVKNGLMKGYPDTTFQPLGNAKRAEAVTVVVNAFNLEQATNQADVAAEAE